MTEPKYKIGDTLFVATVDRRPNMITCPDCGGTLIIHAILFDGTEHVIECSSCSHGYEGPNGLVQDWTITPRVNTVHVTGMEIEEGLPVEYKINLGPGLYRTFKEEDLFEDRIHAEDKALILTRQQQAEEERRVASKEQPHKTWARNIAYHRQRIRLAKKELEYHTAKLNAAPKGKTDE